MGKVETGARGRRLASAGLFGVLFGLALPFQPARAQEPAADPDTPAPEGANGEANAEAPTESGDELGAVPAPPGNYQAPAQPPVTQPGVQPGQYPPQQPPPVYGAYPPPTPARAPRPRAHRSLAPKGLDPPPGVAVEERTITGLWLPGLIVFGVSWGVIAPILAAEWEDMVALIPIVGPIIANQEDEVEGPLLLGLAQTAGLALFMFGRIVTRTYWVHFELAGQPVSVTPVAGTDRVGLVGRF